MLVIYRTNEGFEGDVVTVMTGDADLTAALASADCAVLDIELPTADAAALVFSPEKFTVEKGLLCERAGQGDVLAKAREEVVAGKVVVSVQTEAVVAPEEKPVEEKLVEEKPVEQKAEVVT